MESVQNTSTNPNSQIQPTNYAGYSSSSPVKKVRNIPAKKILLIIIGVLLLISIIGIAVYLFRDRLGLNKPKEITLTYWGAYEEESVMKAIIDDFRVTYPNVQIVYEKQDIKGLGKYVERLKTRIDNGTGPDIYRFHSSWTLQMKNHLLVFPQDLVISTQIETDYYKTVQNDLMLNGGYYGIPLGVDTLVLFINNTMLSNAGLQPPREWNDIRRVYNPALIVREDGKLVVSSLALGSFDNIEHAPDLIAMLLLQSGADLSNLNGETRDRVISMLEFYKSFADPTTGSWNKTLDNSKSAFAKGSLAMYFGYASDISDIISINPNLQFSTIESPASISIKKPVASYWAEGVSSRTKNKDEAFAFIQHLSKPETLQKLNAEREKLGQTKLPYPRKSMAKLLDQDPLLIPVVKQADNARTTFFSSNTYDGDTGMITRINNALGKSMKSLEGSSSVDTSIKDLDQEIGQILNEYD